MATTELRRDGSTSTSNNGTGASKLNGLHGTIVEIVAAAQERDRDAQRKLYDLSHRNVYQLMVRMVGLRYADDLTQQVFLQLFRTISRFSGR